MTNHNQVIRPGEVTAGEKAAEDIFTPNPWLDPGEGWRLLKGDEIIQKGDSVYDSRTGQWFEMHVPLSPSVVVLLGYWWAKAVRRRVEPEQPQYALTQDEAERIKQIQAAIDRQHVPPVKQANSIQHGGDHYRSKTIQPWDYIASNGLGFFEGNIVKYVTRWPERGGLVDLRKAQHYIEKLIEIETAKETGQ